MDIGLVQLVAFPLCDCQNVFHEAFLRIDREQKLWGYFYNPSNNPSNYGIFFCEDVEYRYYVWVIAFKRRVCAMRNRTPVYAEVNPIPARKDRERGGSQTMAHSADGLEEKAADATGAKKHVFKRLLSIPITFLGLGVYRAWIEIVFVGSFVTYPAIQFTTRDVFDFSSMATIILCVVFSKKIGSFYRTRAVSWLSGITLTLSTIAVFLSLWFPQISPYTGLPASMLGGFGIALLILYWSELYGCLNPMRVALYYSGSIVLGALILYIYRGFGLPWLFLMSAILPAISIACCSSCFRTLPESELPSRHPGSFSVPWKAILLMAIYAFAYGMMEKSLYSGMFGPHSAIGTTLIGLMVFFGVAVRGDKFDFGIIYRLALPLCVSALLLIPVLLPASEFISGVCISGGYTALSILTMLIFSNICYRYGVSAIWLFGIERSVRFAFMFLGRQTSGLSDMIMFGNIDGNTIITVLTVVAAVAGTMILLSEKELTSRWGATFLKSGGDSDAIVRKQELADNCKRVSETYGLTARESEVLLLLAQKKTSGIIERELFIANGTAKAHIRHIYQKLDIHKREDLYEILGVNDHQTSVSKLENTIEGDKH